LNFNDLRGKTFGKLTVVELDRERSRSGRTYWFCNCDCGTVGYSTEAYSLQHRKFPNCGCETDKLSRLARHKTNRYNLSGEHGIGYTSNTNKEFYFDLEDYDKIKDYCWHENKQDGYIKAPKSKEEKLKHGNSPNNFMLHKLILDISDSNDNNRVDHENKLRYDCRKENIRICTHHQNNMNKGLDNRNKSGVSGVIWSKSNSCWQSYISHNEEKFELGCYDNFKDAVKIRLIKEKEFYLDFAPQQHLYEELDIVNDGIYPIKRTKLKQIYCYETDRIYESAKEISLELNIKQNLINPVARGNKKSTSGYHFKYVEN
jgi:hypothetical protein